MGCWPDTVRSLSLFLHGNRGSLAVTVVNYLGDKWFENSRQLLVGIARSQVR